MTGPARVAPLDYRITDPFQRVIWDHLGGFITACRDEVGDDVAFSVILSRVTRELRRVVGPDETAAILRGLADTQHEAAKADL
jgi:hypothetical protein